MVGFYLFHGRGVRSPDKENILHRFSHDCVCITRVPKDCTISMHREHGFIAHTFCFFVLDFSASTRFTYAAGFSFAYIVGRHIEPRALLDMTVKTEIKHP